VTQRPFRIGTRGSALAIWQTEQVRVRLRARGFETERVEIKTTGDLAKDVPLSQIGSRALFTKQIDDALLEGRIDLAVHSLKDLPTELPAGLSLGAVGEREDPRDALVGRGQISWSRLPPGATIGTSSLRRRAQLLRARPDLRIVDLRGNVETRIAKLDAHPDWTAIVLATAGLVRLQLGHRIGERLDPELMLPAPGQGALAVTVRSNDAGPYSAAREALHHLPTAVTVAAERAFLRRLEGGCQVPVAAYAELDGGHQSSLRLRGRVIALGGETSVEGHEEGEAPDDVSAAEIGTRLAERLLQMGAAGVLADARATVTPVISEP
jgi:hydroxymethylbilane synthase